MKRFASTLSLGLAFGLLGSVSLSVAAETSVTTIGKTTTYSGVVSEINPTTSTIILKSETAAAPVTYKYSKETTFVDAQGKVVSYETIRNAPVTIDYVTEGDGTIVKRVVATGPSTVIHKKETTTHTETD